MTSLWADGWFYISAGGFLVSLALFVFLLGQYRVAIEAEDDAEPEEPEEQKFLQPPPFHDDDDIPNMTSARAAPRPVESASSKAFSQVAAPAAEEPAPSPLNQAPRNEEDVSTAEQEKDFRGAPGDNRAPGTVREESSGKWSGETSPAAIYLQNIKTQMETIDKEISNLKFMIAQQTGQIETILKRLAEPQVKTNEAALSSAPGPLPYGQATIRLDPTEAAPVTVVAPEPIVEPVVSLAPPANPQPQPVESMATAEFRIVPSMLADLPPERRGEPAVTQPEESAPTEEQKTRKGPVWPI